MGGSGMLTVQRYDIRKSLAQLQEILYERRFDMQTNTWNESSRRIHCIWARKKGG
jgi:hypothetical protein